MVDSFEITCSSNDGLLNERDLSFLDERMELRLRGEQWNLFKDLDIVGWYSTSEKPSQNDVLLHKQLNDFIEKSLRDGKVNFFKHAIFFNTSTMRETLYQQQQGQLKLVKHSLEPSTQEMITISSSKAKQSQEGTGLSN